MTTTHTDTLKSLWLSLPEDVRSRLLLGYTGRQHLLEIVGTCLRAGAATLGPLAANAIQSAFGENPLDGEMAGELLRHDVIRAILPPTTTAALGAVSEAWRKPEDTSRFEQLVQGRDIGELTSYLAEAIRKEPENLFWRQHAMTFGLIDNDPAWVHSLPEYQANGPLAPVIANMNARLHVFEGQFDKAVRLYQGLGEIFGPSFAAMQAGLALLAAKDRASANFMLMDALARAPWNTNLLLRVHDLLFDLDRKTMPLQGSTAILLYTWNKGVELDATLRSLFESDLTGASIFILDNGSTDTTPSVLESWKLRFRGVLGPGRFDVLPLPVNIGAPAARNWLMHHPPVAAHDFLCYLDDDVVLPPDWLLRLGTAVNAYPAAGVWGCKVVDHANPSLIQSADNHLLVEPDNPGTDLSEIAPNPFRLSDLHIQTLDAGQFDTLRPCASVTGCCHLFRTERLLETGDFAIHLSPSQYDDMEHDLRLCESGNFPVYQGHLTVRHKKSTGAASRLSMQEEGNALGNKYKMQTMHTRENLLDAMDREKAMVEADLLTKMRVVNEALTEG